MTAEIPARLAKLPRWRIMGADYPVPYFVTWYENGRPSPVVGQGEPDFRMIHPRKFAVCVRKRICWVCGQFLGVHLAFVIGPMCAITRTTSEPGSHRECAVFSAQVCPFLTRPQMRRHAKALPEQREAPPGRFIERNPGVACVWITRTFEPFRVEDGTLFKLGDPESVSWYAHGREATRQEVMDSIDSGYPALHDIAEAEGNGAIEELARLRERAMVFLPAQLPA